MRPSEADRPVAVPTTESTSTDLPPGERFLNRELSWLQFNDRVLAEAFDARNPLLERVRFLSIFGSNTDEFFMIRVSGLRDQMQLSPGERSPDGMTPAEQLAAIRKALLPMTEKSTALWYDDLVPKLAADGIRVLRYGDLKKKQRKILRRHFETEIFPVLTPLAFDPGHPFPHISNLSLNLAVVVRDPEHGERFARLKVPTSLPRLLNIPDEDTADEQLGLKEVKDANYVWLEEVIAANLDLLFHGLEVVACFPFRVTRDADLEIEEDEASDLLTAMAQVVEQRQFGTAVRLEIDAEMPDRIRSILVENLDLAPYQVYTARAPLGVADLAALASLEKPKLRFPPHQPVQRSIGLPDEGLFAAIRRRDVILHHPYDSFSTVLSFLTEAARDPQVVAIKQTLYRVGPNSPIVEALKQARENDKQVAVLVELKARFDEENNIVWAQELDRVGVHVVYGIVGLKTHAKMTLVVRREREGIRRYVHLGTGNYNPATSRAYTDIGLLTNDPEISQDVVDLFNALTGYSRKDDYQKLVVAPQRMRTEMLRRIDREIASHAEKGGGHIVFKMNALSDTPVIEALYRASQAGVRVDLLVRGICCLRPGVPGLSDNVRVTSIVGRFLEHSRLYWFRNGGGEDQEMLAGSADLMPRNLDHRFEVLFPIRDRALLNALRDDLLLVGLHDNAKSWELDRTGAYRRVEPAEGEAPLSMQDYSMTTGGAWRSA